MLGALINGPIADRIGRRPTLLIALWISGLGSLATAILGKDLGSFVATRIFTGIGLGMIMPIITAYLNEFMPGRSSNVATIVASSGYTLGGVAAGIAGIYVTPGFGWEALFWIGGFGCVIALAMHIMLPESPMFLAQRASGPVRASAALKTLLTAPYRNDSITLWTVAGLALFVIYALGAWIPNVMIARGAGVSLGFFFGSLLLIAGLIGGFACAAICDRVKSRKRPLAAWYALLAVSMLGLAFTVDAIANLALVFAAGFFLVGAQPVLNNLAAHTYPTHARSTGIGFMLGVGRVGAILGPVALGLVMQTSGKDQTMFLVLAAAAAAAAVFVLRMSDRAISLQGHA